MPEPVPGRASSADAWATRKASTMNLFTRSLMLAWARETSPVIVITSVPSASPALVDRSHIAPATVLMKPVRRASAASSWLVTAPPQDTRSIA